MTTDYLAELIRVQVRQLEERIDQRHRELHEQIEAVALEQEALAAAVLARLDAHEEYHRRSEHRWGLVKLAARYPFRFAALAGVAALWLGPAGMQSGGRLMELAIQIIRLMRS